MICVPSISNHDWGGVLVGHDHRRAGQATPVSEGVVGLEWLRNHACVQKGTHFKDIAKDIIIIADNYLPGERCCFAWFHAAQINWLRIRICKSESNSVTILHEDAAARGNFCIFEGRVAVLGFSKVNSLLFLQCLGDSLSLLVTGHSSWWGTMRRHLILFQ